MISVLVCGGRNYSDERRVYDVLNTLNYQFGIARIIEGGARGADRIARKWADNVRGIAVDVFVADWENHGSFAGPMRNQRMLEEGRPDLVVAFPGGRGTADMIRKARRAGVEVVEIAHSRSEDGNALPNRAISP